jgi:HipA-like kinase
MLLRPLAAEIFAFDTLIQNPDRRQVNPNLLTNGDEIYLCDHEQAFSFLAGVIGGKPPWTGQGLDYLRHHVFFQQLRGSDHNSERFRGALEALTDTRLSEYLDAVPNEWRFNNTAAAQIVDYLKEARQNRDALFSAITSLLI